MKFTLNWLKRHLDTDASLEQICETLTAIGLELEECTDPAANFAAFTVAEVVDAQPHPDADKLQVLSVNTHKAENIQVVCGAPNARAGMKGIFAPEGTYIPGLDVTLKKAKIRGVESNGMMVSEKEVCLSDEHKGIIEVDGSHDIGTKMAQIFGLDDPIIEIGLTPNRPDCAGIRGIARDLAAAGLGTLKAQDESAVNGTYTSSIGVRIEDNEGCPLFLGREIKGVKNGPSPQWLQDYLKSIGLRPISALVDITNFFNIDLCRPLHVYDAQRLSGDIVVRKAKAGETFDALNDHRYETLGGETAITDQSGLIGLGGVVGGVTTGSEDNTQDVFLECAYFKPERIARTGRDLGIISDARYRFERGIDPEFTVQAMEMATRMILELCGNDDTQVSEVVTAGAVPDWKREIAYNTGLMETLIGVPVETDKQLEILSSLGFEASGTAPSFAITPPPWRCDVMGAPDITEEIIRIIGFDQIPEVSVHSAKTVADPAETTLLTRSRKARLALAARGMHECVTWSFLAVRDAKAFGLNDNEKRAALTVVNSISQEIEVMRPSILPNLIMAAQNNAARGYGNAALCEVGPIFESVKPDGQAIVATGLRFGASGERHWADEHATRPIDAYDAKADAIAALQAIGAPAAGAQITRDAPEYYHPGRSGSLRLGKNVLAYFGEIHPAILEEMGVKSSACGFEVFLGNAPEARSKGTSKPYLKLEPLQPVHKDFAFIVEDSVEAETLIRAAKSADKNLITSARIFDVYQGKGVEDGKKSLALTITIQPKDETLKDADIEALMNKVIEAVGRKSGGVLRG